MQSDRLPQAKSKSPEEWRAVDMLYVCNHLKCSIMQPRNNVQHSAMQIGGNLHLYNLQFSPVLLASHLPCIDLFCAMANDF